MPVKSGSKRTAECKATKDCVDPQDTCDKKKKICRPKVVRERKTKQFYIDLCKQKHIPIVYERDTQYHKKGEMKNYNALRQCTRQASR